MSWILYCVGFVHVGLAWYGLVTDRSFLVLLYLFGVLPLGDFCMSHYAPRLLAPTPNSVSHDVLLHAWLPLQVISFWIALWASRRRCVDVLVVGILFGQGINVAHELFHRPQAWHKWTARRILELSCYGFFEWQHLLGHHKQVGRKCDPATAPKGMTVFRFIPRSVYGTIVQAYHLDPSAFISTLCRSGLWLLGSWWVMDGVGFHLAVACVSICFLEIINYIEHYGLERGRDENVAERHSWDAPFILSSLVLFKLPLHSDHHMRCTKPYPELVVREDAPKMRYGYPVMIMASLCPPLFFEMMKTDMCV